ncbi:MAG: hypothetical protein GY758_10990 [Fuerstiella sp.]|jgi:hypothetical protein|nr:hypothetical protein [Fuerstiella sp.]MCP4506207.1 hypothetical protein [Fuerstiella sp.]
MIQDVWKRHRVSSDAGCSVVLLRYELRTLWMGGRSVPAIRKLKEAIKTVKFGIHA